MDEVCVQQQCCKTLSQQMLGTHKMVVNYKPGSNSQRLSRSSGFTTWIVGIHDLDRFLNRPIFFHPFEGRGPKEGKKIKEKLICNIIRREKKRLRETSCATGRWNCRVSLYLLYLSFPYLFHFLFF